MQNYTGAIKLACQAGAQVPHRFWSPTLRAQAANPCRLLFGLAGRKHSIPFASPHLGSAVGLLLTHESPRLRSLGVGLLIDFIKCQAGCTCEERATYVSRC